MIVLPPELNTPDFHAAWLSWEQHRRERKPKLTPRAVSLQIKFLRDIGAARAIAAIEHSIRGGYQGIFEERNASRNGKPELHAGLKAFLEDKDLA